MKPEYVCIRVFFSEDGVLSDKPGVNQALNVALLGSGIPQVNLQVTRCRWAVVACQ